MMLSNLWRSLMTTRHSTHRGGYAYHPPLRIQTLVQEKEHTARGFGDIDQPRQTGPHANSWRSRL
jgi:hypothetical protein